VVHAVEFEYACFREKFAARSLNVMDDGSA
jgi:hypothetical protein